MVLASPRTLQFVAGSKRYSKAGVSGESKGLDALHCGRLLPLTQTPDVIRERTHALRLDKRLGLLQAPAKARLLRRLPSRTLRQTEFLPEWSPRVRTPPQHRKVRRRSCPPHSEPAHP